MPLSGSEKDYLVKVILGLDDVKFKAGLKDVETTTKKSTEKIKSSFESVGKTLFKVGAGMTLALTTPILLFAKSTLDAAVQMDSLKRGIIAVDGAGSDLTKTLKRLDEVAKLPGLGLKEAREGYVQLRAAGIEANLAVDAMMGFGNALATVGRGKAEMNGVLLALTQIVSKGKVMAQEINQIAERVPQIRVLMKEAFGTADTEALQKMGMSATEFIEGITEGLKKLPRFTSGAKNALENLDDAFFKLKGTIGELLFPLLESQLPKLEKYLVELTARIEKMSDAEKTNFLRTTAIIALSGPLLIFIGQVSIGISSIATAIASVNTALIVSGGAGVAKGAGMLAKIAAFFGTGAGIGLGTTAAAVGTYYVGKDVLSTEGRVEDVRKRAMDAGYIERLKQPHPMHFTPKMYLEELQRAQLKSDINMFGSGGSPFGMSDITDMGFIGAIGNIPGTKKASAVGTGGAYKPEEQKDVIDNRIDILLKSNRADFEVTKAIDAYRKTIEDRTRMMRFGKQLFGIPDINTPVYNPYDQPQYDLSLGEKNQFEQGSLLGGFLKDKFKGLFKGGGNKGGMNAWSQGLKSLGSNDNLWGMAGSAVSTLTSGGSLGDVAGGLLPMIGSAFGPVGAVVGTLLGGLFGKKKQRGADNSTPVFVNVTNWDGFWKTGFSLPTSFVMSGRSNKFGVDPHGRELAVAYEGWRTGQHFNP